MAPLWPGDLPAAGYIRKLKFSESDEGCTVVLFDMRFCNCSSSLGNLLAFALTLIVRGDVSGDRERLIEYSGY
jgi:hypothetical protein